MEVARVVDRLKNALNSSTTEVFECEMQDNPLQRAQVIVNGAAVPFVAVYEQPDDEPVLDVFVA